MSTTSPTILVNLARGTLYLPGGLGNFIRVEAREIKVWVAPWAQYGHAVHFSFIKKGARKAVGLVQTYEPSLVILEGWGHMEPGTPWGPESAGSSPGVTVSRSLYSSCDPRWKSDFNTALAAYVKETGAKIAADFRGHNSYSGRIEVPAATVAEVKEVEAPAPAPAVVEVPASEEPAKVGTEESVQADMRKVIAREGDGGIRKALPHAQKVLAAPDTRESLRRELKVWVAAAEGVLGTA